MSVSDRCNEIFCDSNWIWSSDNHYETNQYVEFRRAFECADMSEPKTVYIAADSDYELWVNGEFAGWNQYPNWPKDKTYNHHDVGQMIKTGQNCIAIRVYYRGEDFSVYAKGKPGLIFTLVGYNGNVIVKSDRKWKCRESLCYKSGAVPKTTVQIGYTIEYDARCDDEWQFARYNDSSWSDAVEVADLTVGYWDSLSPRPIKQLQVHQPKLSKLIASGYILRNEELETVAKTMMADAMISYPLHESCYKTEKKVASRLISFSDQVSECFVIDNVPVNRGVYLIFDLGSEEVGLLDIKISAPVGTVLDIAYGEHLDDMRVRAHIVGRNFADRYICKEGLQQWMQPYRRLGGRYIQVHIPEVKSKIHVHHLTLRQVEYPLQRQGEFTCNDSVLNNIWDISVRTLTLCMHEHYEDCPWREQALYACDSRLQALFGYYAFGEYDFPAASFRLLSGGMRDDEQLELTAPARVSVNIPEFSLHWIMAIWELFLYSGKIEYVAGYSDKICRILDRSLSRMQPEGVVANSKSPDHWHFHEWAEGLDGYIFTGLDEICPAITLDAIYNLFLIGALRAASYLGKHLGDNKLEGYSGYAQKIVESFHDVFWNGERRLYASFVRDGHKFNYSQLTQSLAIIEKVVPNEIIVCELCKRIIHDSFLVKAELSSLLHVYEALLQTDCSYLNFVIDDIKVKFGEMLKKGATSLWETVGGSSSFLGAGSLCHAWSSIFCYIAGAYILGFRPLEPGFKKHTFDPAKKRPLNATGQIPTPFGYMKFA